MKHIKVKKKSKLNSTLEKNKRNTNFIFLGVGLSLFALNIATFLTFIKTPEYSKVWFDISILSSMIIVIVVTYNIFER